ncbi:hypothetical protein V3C99_012124 [Haemonchus contortus]
MCWLLLCMSTLVGVVCDELLLVQTVFRHGDRAPMGGSTSKESETYYFRGKEQLTDKGLEQAHQLGLDLRRRYVDNGFLSARYLPSEVVFRSSSSERCLMTASAAASAMFNLTANGQPVAVPIFTVPKEEDYVCVPRIECPFVLREMAELLGFSETVPSLYDMLLELFKQESERLNYTRVIGDRLHLFEPLFLEQDAGLPVPQWFDDEARKEADHLLDLTIEFLSGTATFHNRKWILTRSGKLLYTILRNQRKAVEQTLGGVKFFAFSTHDATISALLDSLGILKEALAPQGRPDFTAAITLEVWRNKSDHYVKVSYRRGSSSHEFIDLITSKMNCRGLDGCTDVITRASENYGIDTPQSLCEDGDDESDFPSGLQPITLIFMASTGLLAVLLLAAVIAHIRYRSSEFNVESASKHVG